MSLHQEGEGDRFFSFVCAESFGKFSFLFSLKFSLILSRPNG